MKREDVIAAADTYLDAHWSEMLADITRLVKIPSFEDEMSASSDAPFGAGPRAALSAALDIADNMGFETKDLDGYVGYADFEGKSDIQIGIIGHVDVVPAGPGWHVEPYDVSIKEGYLVGRGVIDDKGSSLIALHAMKCLKDLAENDCDMQGQFPYTLRFIFGANEETGMSDVPYYRTRCGDPAFLFTPDAEFPVSHGEKGVFQGTITSAPIFDGHIVELAGGTATNAVPGEAYARVWLEERSSAADQFAQEVQDAQFTEDSQGNCSMELPECDGITVTRESDEIIRIDAKGKSAHASLPDEGINALTLLVDYVLDHNLVTDDERVFFELDRKLLDHIDGSGLGLDTRDDAFGALTAVGGVAEFKQGVFTQTIDVRFPTSLTSDDIKAKLSCLAKQIGGRFEVTDLMEPFLIDADEPEIQALLDAYNEITGEKAQPFTMGGATYAREFKKASSFGIEMPWLPQPDWAGGMHATDEAANIDQFKTAFKIYTLALYNLEQLEY